jgi:signal transduction histidine kinase
MDKLFSIPKPLAVGLALALMTLIGFADYVTGRDFSLSAFYLMPICWVAWVAGRRLGIMVAVFGAINWLTADLLSGFIYPYKWMPCWNAAMLLVLFLVLVQFLTSFRTAHSSLKESLQERTNAVLALQAEIKERKRLEAEKLQAERLALVGKLAAQVAHEVRNPLGSITLNLDLIQKELNKLVEGGEHSPDEARALIDDMRAEVRRIVRVIEDYLQFARLPKLQRQPLALNAFLDEKLAFIRGELEGAGVKLHMDFDPSLSTIHASGDQLWQAMLNLIRNSREAMPRGGELTISTRHEGGNVVLRVADSGIGMTGEQKQNVFVPFYTTKKEGVGLGMALVQQIVTEHGGRIECESASGAGSRFIIFLPAENPR